MAGGRVRWITTLMLTAAALVACSTKSPYATRPAAEPSPADAAQTQAESAVREGMNRQVAPPRQPAAPGARRKTNQLEPGEAIWIQSGKSRVLQLSGQLRRVSIGNPDLAGIVVLGPSTLMVNAKEIKSENPGNGQAQAAGMVTGRTLTNPPNVVETTLIVWDGRETPDVHTLFIADFIDQQVMLEVTVAEINRTAMEEHGIDFRQMAETFASAYFMGGGVGPKPPGGTVSVPPFNGAIPLTTADGKPTYAFSLPKDDITAFIQILQVEGLARILAQPKLLAMSGQNAVFQVGGEIPIRIATGFTSEVEFKPFGTLVSFLPRVSEEEDIMLTVTPEVSQPDFNSPVEGIPSFRTRRASTSVRLRNGETLVIGGLLQNNRVEQVTGVPYLQDIPVLGYVFRHTTYTNDSTELMVVVTPRLVRPLAPDVEVALPTDRGALTNEEIRTRQNPNEVSRPRIPGLP